MPTFKAVFGDVDITTRPKRRQAVSLIITQLSRILNEEEAYLNRIPMNMKHGDAAEAADWSIDYLQDAIIDLMEAYDS
jgi:hypothetical protein